MTELWLGCALLPAASIAADRSSIESVVLEVMEEWQAPGAVVAVIDDGAVAHARGYGVADARTREPVDIDRTLFRLASLSKPVTATALMKLWQEGLIDLDADLNGYLRSVRLRSRGRLGTSHLLTHTGGFEDRFLKRMTRSARELPPLADYLAAEMPRQAYAPGDLSLYSNHGMALAGLLVEEVSGRPFPTAMRELVFEPLDMLTASFDLGTEAGDKRLAQGYRFGEAVVVRGLKTVPASMLVASGRDMTRWMLALLVPEESRLLEPATVKLMLRRHFEHHPSFTGRALGFSEDSSVTPRRLFHSGGTDGFSSAVVLVPERRGGIFVAFNGNAYVWELVRSILDDYFPAKTTPARPFVASSLIGAEEAAGRYVPAKVPRSSFDKVRLLFEHTVVGIAPGGALAHRGDRFEPESDGTYRSDRNGTVVLRRGKIEERFLLEEGRAWVRIAWHAAWPLERAECSCCTTSRASPMSRSANGWGSRSAPRRLNSSAPAGHSRPC